MRVSIWTFSLAGFIGIASLVVLLRAQSGQAVVSPSATGSVPTFAGNAQHTGIYEPAARNLNTIRWSTSIDLNNSGGPAHYGAPVITAANTILVPVKTATDGFQVNAFEGSSGVAKYTVSSDYVLPTHTWIPVYNPCLATRSFGTRLYYAGIGGTLYHIDNPDSAMHGAPVQEAFYTSPANYLANAAAYNSTIFINTPLTSDSQGNIFFGFRVQGTAPAPLSTSQSGFARIDPSGNGSYILAGTAANDASIDWDSHNSAPALSNDESTLYVVAKSSSTESGYLIGLDSTTLAPKHRVSLRDPRNNKPAGILDIGTASPTIAPDNDVYIGVMGNPLGGARGFLLHFNHDLTAQNIPGAFGWDYTPAIVPAAMVPFYQGPSAYLIFVKYNNYAFGDGDGVNRVALLDPNSFQIDPHSSAPSLPEMREVLTLIGPTPDADSYSPQFPYAVREWCINTAAVNPATSSIFIPNEDGRLYRWNVAANSFAQAVTLTAGVGEPYVPSLIGPDGTVYTLNGGTLFALGPVDGVEVTLGSSAPDVRTVVTGDPVTFTVTVTDPGSSGAVPSGTVTFQDLTYQDLTPATTTLASDVPLDANGRASVTVSNLTAGNGFLGNHVITTSYSGDANFSPASATLVQKVHAQASVTNLISSPNPSAPGEPVSFTAAVTGGPPNPTGMVTFQEGPAVLAQIPLSGGSASFTTPTLSDGNHTITAIYQSDTVFALSSGETDQAVGPPATPTPTPTPTPSPTPTPTPTPSPTPAPTATPTPTAPQAINLSTRLLVDIDEKVGIGGFIITGSAPKRVLLRAIGPSLTQSNVPNALADPMLELYGAGATPIAVNNDWKDTQASEIRNTRIPPSNDLESAILATLEPGNYTAIVKGKDETSGVALVELYDLDPAAGKLGNISTRAFVGTGGDIAIAGFILGNQAGTDRIVIRGLGPSLSDFGITSALANPSLELRSANGTLLISNNDWEDNPEQAAQLVAAGLALPHKLESGIAIMLAPGRYTALLSGENADTGIGLVEVYDLGP